MWKAPRNRHEAVMFLEFSSLFLYCPGLRFVSCSTMCSAEHHFQCVASLPNFGSDPEVDGTQPDYCGCGAVPLQSMLLAGLRPMSIVNGYFKDHFGSVTCII